MPEPAPVIPDDFALFEDGPFLRPLRRIPALRPIVTSPARRILVAVGVTWLPLLILSIRGGVALHGVALPFLADIQTQIRMLITLPLFIFTAHQAHRLITPALALFVNRGVVRENDRERFRSILQAASSWNHSVVVRLAIIVIVVFFGRAFWEKELAARQIAAWYGEMGASGSNFTAAGQWFVWIAYPLFQYIHLLWILRLFMFGGMLARIAALDLHLVPTHPDRSGGMGFLGNSLYCLIGFAMAEGATVAGILADRIFYEARPLTLFRLTIAVDTVFFAILVLGPTCVFIPRLFMARRKGLVQYGEIANRYVRKFEEAWVLDKAEIEGRELLGSSDIQSLADMSGSFQVVNDMRLVPFSNMVILEVVAAFLLPIAPLLLTVIPAEALLDRIVRGMLG
jgi:hypothetical protein